MAVEFKDRRIERENTYTMLQNKDGTVTLIPVTGQVYEPGTALNAQNLNANFKEINSQLEHKANKSEVDALATNKADKNTTYTKTDTYNKNEVDNKTWTMANMGQDVKTAMTGGSVAVVGEDAVDTINLKDSSVTSNKTKFYSGLYDIFTYIEDIEYTKIGAYDCNIKLNSSNGTLYIYNKSKKRNIVILPLNVNIRINNGNYYFVNLDTNELVISDTLPSTENFITLAYCQNGEIKYGVLKPLIDNTRMNHSELLEDRIIKLVATVNNEKDIFIQETEDTCYIKFGYIYTQNQGSLQWGTFKTRINDDTRFVTSPNGNEDCFKLNAHEMLLDNYTIIDFNNDKIPFGRVPILINYYGKLKGHLVETYSSDMKVKVDKISQCNGVVRLKEKVKDTFYDFLTRANTKVSNNSFSILFLTDTHFYKDKRYSYVYQNYLRQIENNIYLSVICDGGDSLQDGVSKKEILERLIEFNNNKQLIKTPYVNTVGNHDANAISSNAIDTVINNKERHSMFATIRQHGAVFDKNNVFGNYYYYDDDINKVRYISLNCHDIPYVTDDSINYKWGGFREANYSNEQLNWVANVALDLIGKEDYVVIPIGHSPLDNTGIIDADAQPKNSIIMFNIFKSFVDGTAYNYTGSNIYGEYSVNVDFTGKQGIIPVHLFGHTHRDNFAKNTFNMYNQPDLGGYNTYNPNEFTFTILTIDKKARKVYATRHGKGTDLEFSY